MATEKRLIDANKIQYKESYVPDGDVQWEYKKAYIVEKSFIDNMTSVDAIEVIRCKDCKNHLHSDMPNRVWCKRMSRYMTEDGFCSEGDLNE